MGSETTSIQAGESNQQTAQETARAGERVGQSMSAVIQPGGFGDFEILQMNQSVLEFAGVEKLVRKMDSGAWPGNIVRTPKFG